MGGFKTMLKMNLRLLLRNKGYICFVFLLPLSAVLLLNLPAQTAYSTDGTDLIQELYASDDITLNMANDKITVKVYDGDSSWLSEHVLKKLAETGFYNIYRYKAADMTHDEVYKDVDRMKDKSNIALSMYIKPDLSRHVLDGDMQNCIVIFNTIKDQRSEVLTGTLNELLGGYRKYSLAAGGNMDSLKALCEAEEVYQINKTVKNIETGQQLNLTDAQKAQSYNMGYSLAVVSISFLFSGVFIASIFVEEKQSRVLKRIFLSNTGMVSYGAVKLSLAVITVMIQTCVTGIGIQLFVSADFGISLGSYLFFIFGLGLIFNTLSIVAGMIADNILSANYIAFFIWSISAMLSGLYFPVEKTVKWWIRISLLMPQRWVIKSSQMLMAREGSVYITYLLVVCGFMAVIISTGLLGIKLKSKE